MRKGWGIAVAVALALTVPLVASAQGATRARRAGQRADGVPGRGGPAAAAATNTGDVVALAGPNVVGIEPNGKQKPFAGDDLRRRRSASRSGSPTTRTTSSTRRSPERLRRRPSGAPGILKISANGKRRRRSRARRAWWRPTASGLDSATGYLYVTDIFGNAIWRFTPGRLRAALDVDRDEPAAGAARRRQGLQQRRLRLDREREDPEDPDQPQRQRRHATVWAQVTIPASSSTTWCSTTAPATST